MTKVTLDLPGGEIVRILSQLSSEEREVLKPKFISIEEVLKLKGIISVGGDALIDSERLYDE
jgi:hypothetical protein